MFFVFDGYFARRFSVILPLRNAFIELHRTLIKRLMRGTGQELNAEYMEGIESPEEWRNITRGLVSRGYSDQEMEKIIGGNALRIIEQVVG